MSYLERQNKAATKTGTYSVLDSDNVLMLNPNGGAFSTTLPTAVGRPGKRYTFINANSSSTDFTAATINTTSAQTIGQLAATSFLLHTRGEAITVESDGSNWQIVNRFIPGHEIDCSSLFAFTNLGTVSAKTVFFRRVGSNALFRGVATAGTVVAGTFSIDLTGFTIKTANFGTSSTQIVGMLTTHPGTSQALWSTNDTGLLFIDTAQNAKVYMSTAHGATAGTFNKISGASFYSSNPFSFVLDIPIVNWEA